MYVPVSYLGSPSILHVPTILEPYPACITVCTPADVQSVAGGIPAGMTPLESMVKECDEEASLPEEFVRSRLR
jgi:hypothetical protein